MKTPQGYHVVTVRCAYCAHEAQVSDETGSWVCEDGSLKFGPTPDRGRFLPEGWHCVPSCRREGGPR